MEFGECLYKVANEGLGSRIVRGAQNFGRATRDNFMAQAPAVVGGLGASIAANKAVKGIANVLDRTDKMGDKFWQKFIEKYPEYEGDEKAREFFDVLMESNPSMAKHPVMVKSYLGTTYDHADAIAPDTVQTLSRTEKNIADRKDRDNRLTEVINENLNRAIENMGADRGAQADLMAKNLRGAETMSRLIDEKGYAPEEVVRAARNPSRLANHIYYRNKAKRELEEERS